MDHGTGYYESSEAKPRAIAALRGIEDQIPRRMAVASAGMLAAWVNGLLFFLVLAPWRRVGSAPNSVDIRLLELRHSILCISSHRRGSGTR